MNTVIVIIGAILLVVIFYTLFKSYFFSNSSKLVNSSNLNIQLPPVSHTSLVNPTSTRYSYLLWIYVNSWDKSDTTNNRVIFSRLNDMSLYLDPNANLVCQMSPSSPTSASSTPATNINVTNNFPLQKWVCIEINVDNTIVDVYLDGKMVKSVQVPQVVPDNVSDVNFGKFDANIAQFTRNAFPIDPQTAWNNYLVGNGGSSLSSTLSSYNLTLSLLKDNVVTSKFSLY
jgi:hypothetical protein